MLTDAKIYDIIYLDKILNSDAKEEPAMGMNETMKALSDPVRRGILQLLKNGRKSAGEISEHFALTGARSSGRCEKSQKNQMERASHHLCGYLVTHFIWGNGMEPIARSNCHSF